MRLRSQSLLRPLDGDCNAAAIRQLASRSVQPLSNLPLEHHNQLGRRNPS
ncbi:hypothetical protein RMSM_01970 [Rhodopirellula maiorica SM1]|uniref:Uncharacterized protein n=1 Tax=Rhodopirellula maiorica SM1 TaxID=1265738 RepID=M5S4H7_9BACT|nr:hypothetical protein RMSM_01970 [Rhodopirellula maiorica SM1]